VPDQVVHLVQETRRGARPPGSANWRGGWRRWTGVPVRRRSTRTSAASIAERLVPAPFARGDVMTRQGAVAHWLYLIVAGEAEVYWEAPEGERRLLTRLPPGQVFGEMGLMTGAPRSATVVAATDVECYRLDKASFEDIIRERPALAEGMSRRTRRCSRHCAPSRAKGRCTTARCSTASASSSGCSEAGFVSATLNHREPIAQPHERGPSGPRCTTRATPSGGAA
jgi:hypothetical protein